MIYRKYVQVAVDNAINLDATQEQELHLFTSPRIESGKCIKDSIC
jgi:hypothetical protein